MSNGSKYDIEILVVEAEVVDRQIRFINGYAPQENDPVDERIKFFARSGFIHEMFKPDMAGDDVFKSLGRMFNLIKSEMKSALFMKKMSITSLYKNMRIFMIKMTQV